MSGTCGNSSSKSPSRFGSISALTNVKPVAFPPGRPKLSTNPAATGSAAIPKTIGTSEVAFLAACAEASPSTATSRATLRFRRSVSSLRESPVFQSQIAVLQARLRAARAYLDTMLDESWDKVAASSAQCRSKSGQTLAAQGVPTSIDAVLTSCSSKPACSNQFCLRRTSSSGADHG